MVAPQTELAGKTIGFVGFGNVAQKTADIAAAFGMRVIANSRTMKGQENRKNFSWVGLDELCAQAGLHQRKLSADPPDAGDD